MVKSLLTKFLTLFFVFAALMFVGCSKDAEIASINISTKEGIMRKVLSGIIAGLITMSTASAVTIKNLDQCVSMIPPERKSLYSQLDLSGFTEVYSQISNTVVNSINPDCSKSKDLANQLTQAYAITENITPENAEKLQSILENVIYQVCTLSIKYPEKTVLIDLKATYCTAYLLDEMINRRNNNIKLKMNK